MVYLRFTKAFDELFHETFVTMLKRYVADDSTYNCVYLFIFL